MHFFNFGDAMGHLQTIKLEEKSPIIIIHLYFYLMVLFLFSLINILFSLVFNIIFISYSLVHLFIKKHMINY